MVPDQAKQEVFPNPRTQLKAFFLLTLSGI